MLDIETSRTALLVMDFQNDLVDAEGAFASQCAAAEVKEKRAIESTARVLATARSVGLSVVHVAVAWRPGHPEATAVLHSSRASRRRTRSSRAPGEASSTATCSPPKGSS